MSRSLVRVVLTTFPSMTTSPDVGSSRPATMRSKVVFPQPEGPTMTRRAPWSTTRSTSRTAQVPSGKILLSPLNSSLVTVASVAVDGHVP